jgi:hypothetical protein
MKLPKKPPAASLQRPLRGWGSRPHQFAVLLARRSTAKVTLPSLRFLETPLDDCPNKDHYSDTALRDKGDLPDKTTPRDRRASH